MPVHNHIHVFASHKGGTGKTQLCFQIATQYAQNNPDKNVMLFDMTELGDLTKRCLGGASLDERVLEEHLGTIFKLIDYSEKKNVEGEQGTFARLASIFTGGNNFNLENDAIKPSSLNNAVPENVFLISSGAATFDDANRDPQATVDIAEQMRACLETSDKMWKVFIDTDGDRRPAPFTKLAYALADNCIIPIAPDESDFQRLEPMFDTMNDMYEANWMKCRIQFLCWNKLQLYKKEPGVHGTFTTPKVTTDMITYLNNRLFVLAEQYPNLFVHSNTQQLDMFSKAATALVRDFPDTCALPANANGIPFCRMKPGKVGLGDSVTFQIKQEQIDSCVENIEELLGKLDSMEMDG